MTVITHIQLLFLSKYLKCNFFWLPVLLIFTFRGTKVALIHVTKIKKLL